MLKRASVPYGGQIIVHLFEILFRHFEGVWGWVKLIGFEALIGQSDLERFVVLLKSPLDRPTGWVEGNTGLVRRALTAGTFSFSAWEEAASVVTARLDRGSKVLCLSTGAAPFNLRPPLVLRATLVNMMESSMEGTQEFRYAVLPEGEMIKGTKCWD